MSKPLTKQKNERISATALEAELVSKQRPEKAMFSARFFKTGPGEYGEGDRFLGLTVPQVRLAVKPFSALPMSEIRQLLKSPWHEVRLAAVIILAKQADRARAGELEALAGFYLAQSKKINNWDLVDVSAPRVVGRWLWNRKEEETMQALIRSASMWERRIGVLASFWFIREGDVQPSLRLASRLLEDPEDLMHKAVGWMLREVGKKDETALRGFLMRYGKRMPRTALRYAIERFPEAERKRWLVETR